MKMFHYYIRFANGEVACFNVENRFFIDIKDKLWFLRFILCT